MVNEIRAISTHRDWNVQPECPRITVGSIWRFCLKIGWIFIEFKVNELTEEGRA